MEDTNIKINTYEIQKEYIKKYQKNRYNNDFNYREKTKEKNKNNYNKKKDNEEFKAKQKLRNNKAYQAILEMKNKILELENYNKSI